VPDNELKLYQVIKEKFLISLQFETYINNKFQSYDNTKIDNLNGYEKKFSSIQKNKKINKDMIFFNRIHCIETFDIHSFLYID